MPAEATDTAWAGALRSLWTGQGDRLTLPQTSFSETQFAALDADADGSLTVDELARLREQTADASWAAEFLDGSAVLRGPATSEVTGASNSFAELSTAGLVLSVRTESGTLDDAWTSVRQQMLNLFESADLQQRGYLESRDIETQKDVCLRGALAYADRDHNAQLSREELDAWLAMTGILMRGQILVTILDLGGGLFECLDRDHDGLLSLRELRTAASRLKELECVNDERLILARLPRTVHIAVSHGRPATLLPRPLRIGPSWFRAMDRNGDGDVSRLEWKAEPDFFKKCDQNQDGLLSAEEAGEVSTTREE